VGEKREREREREKDDATNSLKLEVK